MRHVHLLDVPMAHHPAWKGPRETVTLKLPQPEKDLLAARARLAGLTYSEYLMALLHQEPTDAAGRPLWVSASSSTTDGELSLAM